MRQNGMVMPVRHYRNESWILWLDEKKGPRSGDQSALVQVFPLRVVGGAARACSRRALEFRGLGRRMAEEARLPRRFSRRSFLGFAALSVASCHSGSRRADRVPAAEEPAFDVAIVGAGMAGLAAAHRLAGEGFSVRVLEARERPGGRVHTLREPFEYGQFAEAGAIFVPASHAVTRRYAREFGVGLVGAFRGNYGSAYFLRGRLLRASRAQEPDWPFELRPEERAAGSFGLYRKYVLDGLRGLGDLERPDFTSSATRHLDAISLADLLRERGASEGAVELLGVGYLGLFGDGIETVSALQSLRDLAGQSGPASTERIEDGSSRLPEAMAEPLAPLVRYGAEVRAIEETERAVRVRFTERGARCLLSARRAIVTLPTTVLRSLELPPSVSPAKRRAIQDVGSTSVTRTYLQCTRRFWGELGMVDTDLPVMQLMDATAAQEGEAGILESYTNGAPARRLAELDEEERVARVRGEIERVFPGCAADFERASSWSWDLDPFARGGYAWFQPGQMAAHFTALGSAEGRLHFAGEHTSPWTGWMQGALEAGERAAREAAEALHAEGTPAASLGQRGAR